MWMLYRSHVAALALVFLIPACSDSNEPLAPRPPTPGTTLGSASAVKFWESNAAVYWNQVAREMVVTNLTGAPFAIRGYAAVSVAQYNAAVAAEKSKEGDVHPSVHAAIGAASASALSYLYPTQAATLEARLDEFLASPAWPGETHRDALAGEGIGRAIAAQVVARAQADRFLDPWTGTVPVGPGLWFSSTPPVGGAWGQARTYFLLSGDQFRPPPPPPFGSPEFLAALAEVRQIADTRTPEQEANAKFWDMPPGTVTPPGYWNETAAKLAVQYHLSERAAAHVFALMNMVGLDAIIASHDAKFTYWFIRPSQADPGIQLAIGLPNFPSYPSNHSTISAGMAAILGAMFPAEKAGLDALAEEAGRSRILGGIHYSFDNKAGLRLGRTIAAWALDHDVKGHESFATR
jgi:membrane-associated phospholipid phosphatase